MTDTDWSVPVASCSPFEDQHLVVAALRRRCRGDRDTWETFAAFVPIVAFGALIAVAGTTTHRLTLATALPVIGALVIGRLRQVRTARRLLVGVLGGSPDAFAEAARHLDRPEEAASRVSALRLAAAHSHDSFVSAVYELEAADAAVNGALPAGPASNLWSAAIAAYGVLVFVAVMAGGLYAAARG